MFKSVARLTRTLFVCPSTSAASQSLRLFSTTGMNASKTLYVGNLSWATREEDLREAFAEFGEVNQPRIITDRLTGRSRGFGFVELDDEAADKAITAMNGVEFQGRALTVNESQPREPREPGAFGAQRRDFRDSRGSGAGSGGGFRDERRGGGGGGYREDRGGYNRRGGDREDY